MKGWVRVVWWWERDGRRGGGLARMGEGSGEWSAGWRGGRRERGEKGRIVGGLAKFGY